MFCGFPVQVLDKLRPCGKCQGCLRQRRRAWVGRLLAEQTAHVESAFITLTYADPELPWVRGPDGEWIWTLQKEHPQKYVRALRDAGHPLRYFVSGEYGTKTGRPHYHLIAFGLGVGAEALLKSTWKKGFVSVYEANARTMSYCAKYCLKGSADGEPPSKTFEPGAPVDRVTVAPFRLFSRNPPLGGGFAKSIADSMQTRVGSAVLIDDTAQLKGVIRTGGDKYPLDRTMKDRVIAELDIPPAMSHAIFSKDYQEPSNDEQETAFQNCQKALRKRLRRNKL